MAEQVRKERRTGEQKEEVATYLLQCYLKRGQRQKALECIKELKERWPEGIVRNADFSFLEEGNFQKFQRENEEQMVAALPGLLSKGEEVELCFYGIMDRRGRNGQKVEAQAQLYRLERK